MAAEFELESRLSRKGRKRQSRCDAKGRKGIADNDDTREVVEGWGGGVMHCGDHLLGYLGTHLV